MMNKHTFIRPRLSSPCRQSGIALFVCLLFTLMITMVAVVGIQSETLSERVAANARDKTLAFQAAEAALRDAETFMANAVVNFNDANGFYDSSDGSRKDINVVAGGLRVYQGAALPKLVVPPVTIVEKLPANLFSDGSLEAGKVKKDTPDMYRITARGRGNSITSDVVVQSIYRRPN
ncbi:PilX N-terminal domain-containing pilus assembly protein [uncultured Tolumonas sp.]|uniref:pilus assembly PilX family protein n=1 Tax=uncultured Tolumonas sp. TaxID=263765 RepID=UPI00292FBF92|nr:PilX N-terminal domain-containing pilus assembly protein [uncultured Tolumonas sp.]